MSIKRQETFCYPFSKKKNGDLSHKWFPIGWSFIIHDIGDGYDPPVIMGDWKNGNLEFLIDDGNWWINFLYPIPIDNMLAWNRPLVRTAGQYTKTETYVRLLNYLEKKKLDTDGKIDIKAFPMLLSRFTDTLQFYTSGSWDGIPNDMLNVYIDRIKILKDKPQLGGWFVIDEPFMGDKARQINKRDYVYNQILYHKNILEEYDDKKEDHPIYIVIRGNGNFDFDPVEKPEYKVFLNDLVGTADYLCDNFYLSDFLNDGLEGKGEFVGRTKTRVSNARKVFMEKQGNVIDTKINNGFMLFSLGSPQSPLINPYTNDCRLSEEQLRYQNYCSWINGGTGCMLWMLSKSDEDAYARGKKVSYEAYKASEFLMNPPEEDLNTSFMYVNNNTSDCQYILRRNPKDRKELLLMVCNNSKDGGLVQISVNRELEIDKIRPLVYGYNWKTDYAPMFNRIKIILPGQTARAYLLTLK